MVNLKYILLKLGGTIHLIFNIGDSLASYPELGCGTFNVNGLGDTAKRQEVLRWIENKNDDIVLLQETHSTDITERQWENSWNGRMIFNHGTSNSIGTAFLIRKNNITVT